jgi:ferredoxin
MILDLCLALEPAFALMDAVVAMEGPGPGNGRPRHPGLVLASRDPVALDVAGAALIGYDPRAVSYLRDAGERGLVEMPASKGTPLPSWVGVPFALARAKRFELVERPKDTDFFVPRFPRFLHDAIRDFVARKPRFSAKRCIACGGCARICPAGALVMGASREVRRVPVIDDAKCVRCYCCHEICPEDAIALKRSFARKARSARSERKA